MKKESTVEAYIGTFPVAIRERLQLIRKTVMSTAPAASESISYGMPAYKLNDKPLVYFGGFAKHIGFYATPSAHEKFKTRISKYKHSKGSVQFPLDQPLPTDLIAEMVKFRVSENNHK